MVDFETFIFAYVFSGCLLHHAGGLIFPVGVFGLVGSRPCGVYRWFHQEPAKGSAAPSHSGAEC